MSLEKKKVVVRRETVAVLEGFDELDVPLQVILEIEASIPDKYLADAALDVYFRTYATEVLGYLDIEVLYEGQEILPTAEFEDGEFDSVGKVA